MSDAVMNNASLAPLRDVIQSAQADAIISATLEKGELCFTVRREYLRRFMAYLANDPACECRMLIDLCGADYPDRDERFEVIYNLLSLPHNHRVRVKVRTDAATPVDSIAEIFSAAGWFEREAWDLYGITFDGHPDLRRILTDYGFEGHPLRKDFPLTGFVELRYDAAEKRVVQEPVHLTQEYRNFDFTSPWEGMTTLQLPGDEKAVKPKIMAGDKS